MEGRGGGEDLDVAGPAEALVPLRAVGGHLQEVRVQAPGDVPVEPVEQGVAGLEGAGPFQVVGHHQAGEASARERLQLARRMIPRHQVGVRPGDLRVAEAVEGEAGGPLLPVRIPAERVAVSRRRAPQVAHVGRRRVLLARAGLRGEHLGVAEPQRHPPRALDLQPDLPRKVLPEVEDPRGSTPVRDRRGRVGDGLQLPDHPDRRRRVVEAERRGDRRRGLDRRLPAVRPVRRPAGVGGPAGPAVHLPAAVVVLAVDEVGGADRALRPLPRGAGVQRPRGSVRLLDHQRRPEQRPVAPAGAAVEVGHAARVPAVAERHPQRVPPGGQPRSVRSCVCTGSRLA